MIAPERYVPGGGEQLPGWQHYTPQSCLRQLPETNGLCQRTSQPKRQPSQKQSRPRPVVGF